MPISDARRRANDKWRAKFEEVRFRMTPERKEMLRSHADANGESLNSFLNRAVDETIRRDNEASQNN